MTAQYFSFLPTEADALHAGFSVCRFPRAANCAASCVRYSFILQSTRDWQIGIRNSFNLMQP